MPELRDAGRMLEAAEQAAVAGDLASADELLRGAARIQEAELGPLHPDLANTLNNLAIVAEKLGRPDDAETFYRRAVAIASASLPVDHPMIAVPTQFEHLAVVTVMAQPPRLAKPIAGLEGFVVGASDPDSEGERDYAVHFNALGEVCTVPGRLLAPAGRVAKASDIFTRSRLHQRRRQHGDPDGDRQ